jgi:peptidoglycan/LPS O-acetylase OafA/YrhL
VRFIGLDFARCVAIALLLLAHIGQEIRNPIGDFFGVPYFYYVSLGGLAVTVFLILSGAVLELKYGGLKIRYLQFISKRCLRIYPVYYLSLLLSIMIYFIRFYPDTGHFWAIFSKLGIRDIILSFTGGYAFVGGWGGPFVANSWFIALIMTMYILFPFLSREINKRPIVSISFLFLISFMSRLIVGKYGILPNRPLDWFPLCRIFEFSLGIYLSIALHSVSINYSKSSKHLASFISFISEISFPLFLIHYSLLFLINSLMRCGVNQLLAICLFILISFALSWIILVIDNRLPKSYILKKIDAICAMKNHN